MKTVLERDVKVTAKILQQGYIVELADGGPWLKNDLSWTPVWEERGVWDELADAELAAVRSLSPSESRKNQREMKGNNHE